MVRGQPVAFGRQSPGRIRARAILDPKASAQGTGPCLTARILWDTLVNG